MLALALSAVLVLASPPSPPSPAPPSSVRADAPVVLFLIDNSASLPPLDPEEKRVAALEKIFGFLSGQPYRLVLFGGGSELFTDDVSRYRNNGLWTDFYFPFRRAQELMREYPPGIDFRIVLITDAILDPNPADWAAEPPPPGKDLRQHSAEKTLDLIRDMKQPLYVILVGQIPEGTAPDRERTPGLIRDMVETANGRKAAPFAQSLASFFSDDGVLLKKFVFRVQPQEGLPRLKPILKRVTQASTPRVEAELLAGLVLPAVLFLALVLGILVRAFPGPGDVEMIELALGQPAHVAADRLHKLESGGWATAGLSQVAEVKDASATFTYHRPALDLTGTGLETSGADETTLAWAALELDALRRRLAQAAEEGDKAEKILALNLEYVARNLDPEEARRILTLPANERRRVSAIDFLRAKARLLSDDALRRSLTEPRVGVVTYGVGGGRSELAPGGAVTVGPYAFVVQDVVKGGRKDVRLVLHYDRVPSLFGLKGWLPKGFQRAFRFRRSSQRLVA